MDPALAEQALPDEAFHRPLSGWLGPSLILAILPGAFLIGLLADGTTEPRWAVRLGAAVCAALVVAALLAALPRRRPVFRVGPRGFEAADLLARAIPWERIGAVRATRHDAAGASLPARWVLDLEVAGVREFLRRPRAATADAAWIRVPLSTARAQGGGAAHGEDVLRSIERFRRIERATIGERARAEWTSQPAVPEPDRRAVEFRARPLPVWSVRFVAALLLALSLSLAFDSSATLAGFEAPRWLRPLLALVPAAGALALIWSLRLWTRRIEARIGPGGLFLQDRTRGSIPWQAIEHVEFVFDPTVIGRGGAVVGWTMRIALRDPGPWLRPSSRRQLAKDGAVIAAIGDLASQPQPLVAALQPYVPVSVRPPAT